MEKVKQNEQALKDQTVGTEQREKLQALGNALKSQANQGA